MKFLLISGYGDGLGLAFRLRSEGNDVASWVRASEFKENYDGLIHKLKRWEEFLDQDTVVLFDSPGAGKTADRLRLRGHKVVGASTFSDQLMKDWPLVEALAADCGVATSSVDANYCVQGWFDGEHFLPLFVASLETRKVLDKDLGPAHNRSTAVLAHAVGPEDPGVIILNKLEECLTGQGYIGPVTVGVSGDALCHLDFCFQFDRWIAFLGLLATPFTSLFENKGELTDEQVLTLRVGMYPITGKNNKPGEVVGGLTREDRPHLYFHNIRLNERNQIVMTGAGNDVVTIQGTIEQVYEIAGRVLLKHIQYRTDMKEVAEAYEGVPTNTPESGGEGQGQAVPDLPVHGDDVSSSACASGE